MARAALGGLVLAVLAHPTRARAEPFAMLILDGEVSNDWYGWSMAGLGDVDGDGYADFAVGAHRHAGPGGAASGRVSVYSGRGARRLYALDGEGAGDFFGYAIERAPDADGDGREDLVVGAYQHTGPGGLQAGRVYLYSGANGSLLHVFDGEQPAAQLGRGVGGVPDVDGDGRGDVVAGAYNHEGSAGEGSGVTYVYSGATGAVLHRIEGEAAGDNFGFSVAGVPDADGDGRGDFVTTALLHAGPGGPGSGRAYLYSGRTGALLHHFDGEAQSDNLGRCVSNAGDVNGDQRGDYVVGADKSDGAGGFNSGRAYVISGASGALLHRFDGEGINDAFGDWVGGGGDFDGDGLDDLIVGAFLHDGAPGFDSGKVYIFSGATGALMEAIDGQAIGDRFAYAAEFGDDVDADGHADLLVGAYLADGSAGINSGRVYLYGFSPFTCGVIPFGRDGAGSWIFVLAAAGLIALIAVRRP
ncbi:MAG: FG-GAP repeat protein [Myxococcales bacterium]|nr:FG-GAP repeat protein [Myxococcales bacterium]